MRVVVLIFALIGAAGGGLMGWTGLSAVKGSEADIEAARKRPDGSRSSVNEKGIAHVKLALYAMVAGVPLGVIGGALALNRKGVIAGILLLVTYAVPFIILAVGGELELPTRRGRWMNIFLFPAGFVIAGLCAFFVRPARKKPNDENKYDDEEDDHPRRRRRDEEDADEDDRPRKPARGSREDEQNEDSPRRRKNRDDEEEDDRPPRR